MSNNHELGKKTAIFVSGLAILMALFQLYTSGFGRFPALQQRSIHLAFALILTFYLYPVRRKGAFRKGDAVVNFFASIGALLSCGNIAFVIYYVLYERGGAATDMDIVLGFILIILVLDMTRRIMGWALPIITLIFIAYGFLGSYIKLPYISHAGMDLHRFIAYTYLSTEGLFTVPLGVSATFIAIFVIFASFLVNSGVGSFFMDAASAIAGDKTGGPAKVSVVSSAAMGSISGSAVGNVVTTGSVTIPLMKRMGFPAIIAAGIEGTASTGGQIMPPLMGAAAFIIASIVGKPYLIICIAAFIPAALSFLSVYVIVHFEAERYNIKGLPKESLPKLWPVLKKKGHLILPIGVLVGMLVMGYTAMKAGFYSIIAVILISAVQKETRMGVRSILEAMEKGAKAVLPIAAACACSGIVVGILTLTGLGLKISFLLVEIAGGSLPILLILAMLASILLGMGITTTAAYLLVAIIVAPVLVRMGVPDLAAHMFVFYYAVISTITPPVALAAYAAAGVAGTDPFKTSLVGFRIGIAKFVVPFYVIYRPEIMLVFGSPVKAITALIISFFGIWALAGGACGFVFRPLKIYERLIFLACIPFTVPHNLTWNMASVMVIILMTLYFRRTAHKDESSKTRKTNSKGP
ncbi:MAG: TRAP transporter permease [Deltaproteobacteria bacterium]|nr:TRAP transporter permease [Deltaproteobacteria bacterium]